MKKQSIEGFKLFLAAAIVFAVVLATVPLVSADLPFDTYTVSFQQGVDGYEGGSDTWFRGRHDRWDRCYGDDDFLWIHGPAGDDRKAYAMVMFDDIFGAGAIPADAPGEDIINATLTLGFYTGAERDHPDLEIYPMLLPWQAGTGGQPAPEGASTAGYRFYREDLDFAPEDYWGDTGEFTEYPVSDVDYGEALNRWGPFHFDDFELGEGVVLEEFDITDLVKSWAATDRRTTA